MNIFHCVPFLLLACAACETSKPAAPRTTDETDSLLLEVSATEQNRIAEAREACNHATDTYAAAKAHSDNARNVQTSADRELEVVAAKVRRVEDDLTRIRTSGTTEAVDGAKQTLEQAKSDLVRQTATTKLRARETAHALALAVVAREHVAVAEARAELAKAKAVNTLDRPAAQKPSLIGFEESVRRAEADENLARTRADATQREVEIFSRAEVSADDSNR